MHLQWQLGEPLIFSDWFLFPVTSPHLLSLILLVFLVIICLIFSGCKFLEKRLLPVSFPLSLKLRRGLYYSGCSGWRMSEWKPKSPRQFREEIWTWVEDVSGTHTHLAGIWRYGHLTYSFIQKLLPKHLLYANYDVGTWNTDLAFSHRFQTQE